MKMLEVKSMFFLTIIAVLMLAACEKDEPAVQLKSGQLGVQLSDTVAVFIGDTLYFEDNQRWISLNDVPEDSRCPINVNCVWAGNAIADLIYYDGTMQHEFMLHTNPTYPNDTVIENIYVDLVDVLPYPESGQDMDLNAYEAFIYITDDTSFTGNEHIGTVVDYTGLDGCGFIIELDNGKKLEPVKLPEGFQLYDGQRVSLDYVKLDAVSICMVGETVEVTNIENIGCTSYAVLPFDATIESLPSDELFVQNVEVVDGCLKIIVKYSGGCKEHEIDLVQMPLLCATPPLPRPVFYLTHDDNGDLCEALPREELSFDLKPLKTQYPEGTDFILKTTDKEYSKEFHIDF
jgi:hypothetical protein